MAKVLLQKVRITGLKKHYDPVMDSLQKSEVVHIVEGKNNTVRSVNSDIARIDFAIRFLTPYQKKEDKVESVLTGGKIVTDEKGVAHIVSKMDDDLSDILNTCEQAEITLVKNNNRLSELTQQQEYIKYCLPLGAKILPSFETTYSQTYVGFISHKNVLELKDDLSGISHLLEVEELGKSENDTYLRVTAYTEVNSKVSEILKSSTFTVLDLGKEFDAYHGKSLAKIYAELEQEHYKIDQELLKTDKNIKKVVSSLSDLKIMSDYLSWQESSEEMSTKVYRSKSVFVFYGWVAKNNVKALTQWLKNKYGSDILFESISPAENEEAPMLIRNSPLVTPFEDVTKMYALPSAKDYDPTPFLTPFFIVFFGLCLSDVGYGLILVVTSAWFLFMGTFADQIKQSLKLLLICGIAAVLGGIAIGGYFGMSTGQAPGFLLNAAGEFRGQIFNPLEGSGPIIFLGIALALGALQLLTGIVIDFFLRLKRNDIIGAFADSAAWFFFLVSLLCFGMADLVSFLDKNLFSTLSTIGAVLLVITQGRDQKNWLLKPIFGILGLYNITAYLSDFLSYARIMALGLATGVVGFAMNMTAGVLFDMMPHPILGILIALIIIIFGHTLNFALSLLGAFIHSGRLQFIEFFGQFYEGGGKAFTPFSRKRKYIFLKD